MGYRTLRASCVIETIDALSARIAARFPEASLRGVAAELARVARRGVGETERLARPHVAIRLLVYAIWTVGAGAFAWIASSLRYEAFDGSATSFIQILEPAMNIAVLVGLGVITLGRLETTWKRRRALAYLHELRSIAHVVDMHQLTKDPYRGGLPPTAHSPKRLLEGPLLERYLDYCSEMLALTGKLAALLAQSQPDDAVAAAASDVEALTSAISRKIWQKISIISRIAEPFRPGALASASG